MRRIVAYGLLFLTFIPTVLFDTIHAVGYLGQRFFIKLNDRIGDWGTM